MSWISVRIGIRFSVFATISIPRLSSKPGAVLISLGPLYWGLRFSVLGSFYLIWLHKKLSLLRDSGLHLSRSGISPTRVGTAFSLQLENKDGQRVLRLHRGLRPQLKVRSEGLLSLHRCPQGPSSTQQARLLLLVVVVVVVVGVVVVAAAVDSCH